VNFTAIYVCNQSISIFFAQLTGTSLGRGAGVGHPSGGQVKDTREIDAVRRENLTITPLPRFIKKASQVM